MPKSDTKLLAFSLGQPDRPVVAVSLGCNIVGGSFPHADPTHPPTVLAGVLKRVATNPPPPITSLITEFTSFIIMFVNKNFSPIESDADTSVKTWLSGTAYPEWRRKQLLNVAELNSHTEHMRFLKSNLENKCFMKDEGYEKFKHCRGIYSRVDNFKVRVGPIFKLMENIVYKHPSFIKHIPVDKRAAYIHEKLFEDGRKYIATDYTAFESHFTKELMIACEFVLYEHMVKNLEEGPEFLRLLRAGLLSTNRCRFSHFKIDIPQSRMSGEMNTSLGNGFTNFMVFIFLAKKLGNARYDCVIEGDDCLGYVDKNPPSSSDYQKMGFNIKIEIHDKLSNASFCGLIFNPEDYIAICNPHKVLCNTGWISAKYRNSSYKTRLKLLRGKALSMLHQYAGVPIIQSFAQYLLRVTKGSHYKFVCYWEAKYVDLNAVARPIMSSTRNLMEEVFCYTVFEQLELEHYFDSLTTLQQIDHPLILDRISHDQAIYDAVYVREKLGDDVQFLPRVLVKNLGERIFTIVNHNVVKDKKKT